MSEPAAPEWPEYTHEETIAELEAWMNGGRMYPIEVALSSVYWLEHAPAPTDPASALYVREAVAELRAWLGDERPDIPDDLAEIALRCLRLVTR